VTNQLYQLVVRKGPKPGQVFPLELDLLTVGRDPLSDIVIEDPEVSRHHASFTQGDDGFLLQDRGSTNGSFVDGERLGGDPVKLKPGQVIMFGSTVTLVYQATSVTDPMATMVGPVAAAELDEPEPSATDEAPELEPMPAIEVIDAEPEDPFADLEPQAEVEEAVGAVEEIIPSEAVSDDLVEEAADVVAFDVPESQPFLEEDDDAMATMVEDSPVIPVEAPVEPEPLPTFDEPEPLPTSEEPEPEAALPSFPTYDEAEPEVVLPSEPPPLAPLPSFEEPAPEPAFESPSFAIEQEEKGAAFDSGAPIPDFGAESVDSTPIQTSGEIVDDKAPSNRNRNIIIGVVAIVLLCCLCSIMSSAIYFLSFAS